ncbi:MAG: recombination mediator RecR [Bacteroidales bacterium]
MSMTFSDYPSKLLENAVNEFASLPGIGKKTAFRLVMHLLRQNESDVERFGESLIKLKKEIKYCRICFNISDNDICDICSDRSRDHTIICIVENIRDVIAIENTGQYRGLYHVLGGIISPMDGIGPSDLNIDQLEEKVKEGGIDEIIFALSTTMEGDTTNYYIFRRLIPYNIKVSSLSRGVAIGDELEYTDEITLGRSIINRTPFDMRVQDEK